MTSEDASRDLSNGGFNLNINLPDWSSKNKPLNSDDSPEAIAKKKKRQSLIAFGVLALLVVAIIFYKKREQ